MVKRVIFGVWREFSRRWFGDFLAAQPEEIHEAPRRIFGHPQAAQDFAILIENLLTVEPSEDLQIIPPGESPRTYQQQLAPTFADAPSRLPGAALAAIAGDFLIDLVVAHILQGLGDLV
jgi:hypothetical protein